MMETNGILVEAPVKDLGAWFLPHLFPTRDVNAAHCLTL